MFLVTCVGFLAAVQLAASSVQNPTPTPCPGVEDPPFAITSITAKNAKLGQKLQLVATCDVTRVFGVDPTMYMSFALSDGTELPCVDSVFPCQYKTCNPTSATEKALAAAWGDKCPVQPGTYTAELDLQLPGKMIAGALVGDGNLMVTLNFVDQGQDIACVKFPLTIDVE